MIHIIVIVECSILKSIPIFRILYRCIISYSNHKYFRLNNFKNTLEAHYYMSNRNRKYNIVSILFIM